MVLTNRVAVMMMAVVLLSGCFPSRPYSPAYLAYRDTRVFVGVRCFPSLDRIEMGRSKEDDPFWVAVANGLGVRQFELLGDDQPGVTVKVNDVSRMDDGIWWGQVWVTGFDYPADFGLQDFHDIGGSVSSGLVAAAGRVMSWDDYVKMPDGAFGVGAAEGRCN